MYLLVFILGILVGILVNILVSLVLKEKIGKVKILIPLINGVCFEILFLKTGFKILLIEEMIVTSLLIAASFIDIRLRIIPDFIVILNLIFEGIFLIVTHGSLIDALSGMMLGGGIMFLLALVPNAMGGGDIKLMFSVGAFLGFRRTLWALLAAFSISSIVSIYLILLKSKKLKSSIPFAPFLALGSFIALFIPI